MAEERPAKVARTAGSSADSAAGRPPRFHATMLRVRDPRVSVPFYEASFGMRLVHWMRFPARRCTSYFLERQRDGQTSPTCSLAQTSAECERYLLSMTGTALELRHIHGTEADAGFEGYWSGNTAQDADGALHADRPAARGFGHIAFNVVDVHEACSRLEHAKVKFQKKPNEGRMKGLAFALDPDGYWIEVCSRSRRLRWPEYQNLSQTMLRVKDGPRSVDFYTKQLGMTLLCRSDFKKARFSLFFLASLTQQELTEAADLKDKRKRRSSSSDSSSSSSSSPSDLPSPSELWSPVLELTWNHGTERDAQFCVHSGNTDPLGFGHISFLVDNLQGTCAKMEAAGVQLLQGTAAERLPGIAYAKDPDGYSVELVDRSSSFAGICDNYA